MRQPGPERSDSYFTERAFKIVSRSRGADLKVGDVVGHYPLDDKKSYELRSIQDGIAHLGYTDQATGVEVERDCPIEELIDVNRAKDIALELMLRSTAKEINHNINFRDN